MTRNRVIGGQMEAQLLLEIHLAETGWKFDREFKFHPTRDWRFDYLLCRDDACDPPKILFQPGTFRTFHAIEIEGGIYTQGRHTRGLGYLRDLEKYREAAALGYRVYRFAPEEVLKGVALEFLKRIGRDQAVDVKMRYIPQEAAIS